MYKAYALSLSGHGTQFIWCYQDDCALNQIQIIHVQAWVLLPENMSQRGPTFNSDMLSAPKGRLTSHLVVEQTDSL